MDSLPFLDTLALNGAHNLAAHFPTNSVTPDEGKHNGVHVKTMTLIFPSKDPKCTMVMVTVAQCYMRTWLTPLML